MVKFDVDAEKGGIKSFCVQVTRAIREVVGETRGSSQADRGQRISTAEYRGEGEGGAEEEG